MIEYQTTIELLFPLLFLFQQCDNYHISWTLCCVIILVCFVVGLQTYQIFENAAH